MVIFAAPKELQKFYGFAPAPIGFARLSRYAPYHFDGAGVIVRPCSVPQNISGFYFSIVIAVFSPLTLEEFI